MTRVTQRLQALLKWQSRQSALLRWGAALILFAIALVARLALGRLHGANPVLAFYPAILLATLVLGWKEALLILTLSVGAGIYLFIPAGMYMQPFAWLVVGGLNIAIIAGLQHLAQELAAANERQRVLFAELQHRIANTLQAAVWSFEIARNRITTSPDEAAKLLESASTKMAAAADMHRRLHDPTLFEQGVTHVLRNVVAAVIDPQKVDLRLEVEPLDLTFDQMSTITMIVVEAANNAWKHVFQHGRGSNFGVSLQAVAAGRALLVIRDDGAAPASPLTYRQQDQSGAGLGLRHHRRSGEANPRKTCCRLERHRHRTATGLSPAERLRGPHKTGQRRSTGRTAAPGKICG